MTSPKKSAATAIRTALKLWEETKDNPKYPNKALNVSPSNQSGVGLGLPLFLNAYRATENRLGLRILGIAERTDVSEAFQIAFAEVLNRDLLRILADTDTLLEEQDRTHKKDRIAELRRQIDELEKPEPEPPVGEDPPELPPTGPFPHSPADPLKPKGKVVDNP